jgi:C4-dicarboxylate-specific signal transduction histidine kinase
MNDEPDIISEAAFKFFGKMTASISHEIKNVLAIINENAGLLEDYTLMAEKGKAIDPERLKKLAGKVKSQVQRADGIMKNLNKLAQTIDESTAHVDLNETLDLVTVLAGRFAFVQGVTLDRKQPENPVGITTSSFLMQNILWLCLEFAMEVSGEEKKVGLVTEKTETGARVRFTQLNRLTARQSDRFPTEREKALLRALKARLAFDVEGGEIVLSLPDSI